jgi:hypothetical protein
MAKAPPPNAYHAALVLARYRALGIIKRRIRDEGRIKLGTLSGAVLARLANELVDECPSLVESARAEIGDDLRAWLRRR